MHPCALQVRRASGSDAPAITDLWLRSRRASPGIPPPAHADSEVHAWFRDIVLASLEVWVVAAAGELVAVMVLDGESVDQLYVAPRQLRRGHGSRLLDVAQGSRSSLTLWTFEGNLPARAFYEARGFRRVGDPSSDNEERAPAVRYRWTRPG